MEGGPHARTKERNRKGREVRVAVAFSTLLLEPGSEKGAHQLCFGTKSLRALKLGGEQEE